MQSLNEFVEEITRYLKTLSQTIGVFGTFSKLPSDPGLEHKKSIAREQEMETLLARINQLQLENSFLQGENARHRRKVEILTEISQLGLLKGKRKRELWSDLVQV